MKFLGTVTSKGQTTIPKTVRVQLGLREGSRIEWQLMDGKASIVATGSRRAIDLAGMLGDPLRAPTTIEDMDEAMALAISRHVLGEDDNDVE